MPPKMFLVVMRLLVMVGGQLGIRRLHAHTLREDYADAQTMGMSVFRTVYTQCILILVTLLYYIIFKLCRFSSRSSGRGVSGSRLTIRSVWTFVFGMGLVLFIVSYCFVGLNSVCMVFMGLAVSILAVDELVYPRGEMPGTSYLVGRSCALICIVIALCLLSPPFVQTAIEQFMFKTDVYSIIFGLAFPFISQLTLAVVRDSAKYKLAATVELCEFGFPFTAFLGVFHLCVAYGQRQQEDSEALASFVGGLSNHTFTSVYFDFQYWYHFNDSMVNTVVRTDGPFLLFYLLTPLVYVPVCVCFTWCVVNGNAVDPLFAIVAVISMEYPVSTPLGPWEITAVVFCWLGLCVRLLCEYNPHLLPSNRMFYSTQGSGAQLPHFLFYPPRGPSMQECEAETVELCGDCPWHRNCPSGPDIIRV